MKGKWFLIAAIISLLLGVLGIFSFVILIISGQFEPRWIMTLVFAVFLVITGIIQIINRKSLK